MEFTPNEPYSVFEYVIKKLIKKGRIDGFNSHRQLANIVFGKGDSEHSDYLSIVTANFRNYIDYERGGQKYRFDRKKIERDFAHFFSEQPILPFFDQLEWAIDKEISAAEEKQRDSTYFVRGIKGLNIRSEIRVYSLELLVKEEDYLKVYEGMPGKLRLGGLEFDVNVLDYDPFSAQLSVSSNQSLTKYIKTSKYKSIKFDTVWLLEAIKNRLRVFSLARGPIKKFIHGTLSPKSISNKKLHFSGELDASQKEAVEKSISKDVTLIWGPPGTGKSTTLSHIILEVLKRKEKTLVCTIANVALDAIIKKVLDTKYRFEMAGGVLDCQNGQMLRAGVSVDRDLMAKNYLYPNSKEIRRIRRAVSRINDKIEKGNLSKEDKSDLQLERIKLKKQLSKLVSQAFENANLIFATASKVHIDEEINELRFDNLIVDEASMMSVPHFVALAMNVFKRIIVAGDFRQLGPVVLSQAYYSLKWLHKDIFQFAGISKNSKRVSHPALCLLDTQRRFHPEIGKVISKHFYENRLRSGKSAEDFPLTSMNPKPGCAIIYHDLSNLIKFKCETTSKGSRVNLGSAIYIIEDVVKPLIEHESRDLFQIGVITPYRSQVNLYNKLLSDSSFPKDFKRRIKIGTIHAFQGSEADFLIYDLVESKTTKIGRLYWHDTGARLVNVALSRAKGKLIIVGDINAIREGISYSNVNYRVRNVFQEIVRTAQTNL